MRARVAIWLIFLSTLALIAPAQDAPLQGFDAYVNQALAEWQVPGVAIAVVKDDRVILLKGYGLREVGSGDRVDQRTIFGIASNTKAFAAATLAILVDEEKLDWDDPVRKFLPTLEMYDPYVTRELAVRDLLSHRNGLASYGGDIMTWGSSYPREEVLRRIRFVKPVSSFRSQYAYQNGMFVAAGEVVEAVTGKSWDEFVRERIFVPLNMNSTSTSVSALKNRSNVATPHFYVDGKAEPIPWRNIDNLGAAAVINSNVEDLAQWLRLQLNEGKYGERVIYSRKAAHEMWMPQTTLRVSPPDRQWKPMANFSAYGLGWSLRDYHGRKLVRHGGWTDGMLTMVAMIPEEKVGVAILTNIHNRGLYNALMYRIFDAVLGAPPFDWSGYFLEKIKEGEKSTEDAAAKERAERLPGTRPSLALARYAGRYQNEVYGDVDVTLEDGVLGIRFLASPTFVGRLDHWHLDTFRTVWRERIPDSALLTFTIGADGRVRDLTTTLGDFIDPASYTFTRVGEKKE